MIQDLSIGSTSVLWNSLVVSTITPVKMTIERTYISGTMYERSRRNSRRNGNRQRYVAKGYR